MTGRWVYKSRWVMTRGELIEARGAWAAEQLDRRETAKEDAHLAELAAQGIRPHTGRTLWDPSEMRPCEPGCPLHSEAL